MITRRDLTFRIKFNKTLRVSKTGLGRCPSQCEQSESGLGDLSKLTALVKSMFRSIFRFGTFLLMYVTLVGHLNKVWSVILHGTLVGNIIMPRSVA